MTSEHDPGGKVRLRLPEGVTGSAVFSRCGRYRQTLERDWTPPGKPVKTILFIGMNPSVADADVSDPTCHRELSFARDWGFTRYFKGNILDWRATSPSDIPHDTALARSKANLPALAEMANRADLIVMAYGSMHPRFQTCIEDVEVTVQNLGCAVKCFGFNKNGSAKHPL